ncbi:hypothetical protein Pint_21708 [Pistacia integerrima]|uniref:Uncharacterized protein n=1 Tax=Pistacia integerrima TaxID=434235 RepID=A0ACC0XAN8_9ROSI|nr:hypothetical protein Pint_21708 [Pistacia integerrima]
MATHFQARSWPQMMSPPPITWIEQRLLRFLSRTSRFLHPSMKNFSRRLAGFLFLITLGDYSTIFFSIGMFKLAASTLQNTDHSCNPRLTEPILLLQTTLLWDQFLRPVHFCLLVLMV